MLCMRAHAEPIWRQPGQRETESGRRWCGLECHPPWVLGHARGREEGRERGRERGRTV